MSTELDLLRSLATAIGTAEAMSPKDLLSPEDPPGAP
jgi:hypothetical protein